MIIPVAPKFVPVIVTGVPTGPVDGARFESVGAVESGTPDSSVVYPLTSPFAICLDGRVMGLPNRQRQQSHGDVTDVDDTRVGPALRSVRKPVARNARIGIGTPRELHRHRLDLRRDADNQRGRHEKADDVLVPYRFNLCFQTIQVLASISVGRGLPTLGSRPCWPSGELALRRPRALSGLDSKNRAQRISQDIPLQHN